MIKGVVLSRLPKKGRCVFTNKDFFPQEIIEVAPVIPFTNKGVTLNELNDYPFYWDDKRDCIALGIISMCNHSESPNAEWVFDRKNLLVTLKTNKYIPAGTEITIKYGCKLWFNPV
jgi:hypothetical protein